MELFEVALDVAGCKPTRTSQTLSVEDEGPCLARLIKRLNTKYKSCEERFRDQQGLKDLLDYGQNKKAKLKCGRSKCGKELCGQHKRRHEAQDKLPYFAGGQIRSQ